MGVDVPQTARAECGASPIAAHGCYSLPRNTLVARENLLRAYGSCAWHRDADGRLNKHCQFVTFPGVNRAALMNPERCQVIRYAFERCRTAKRIGPVCSCVFLSNGLVEVCHMCMPVDMRLCW